MPCGHDAAGRVGTGCRPGMVRARAWARKHFGGGDLGCFNPGSRAGGVPSLHADGRADDIAFNAFVPSSREEGDRFFHFIIDHADELELQETLWRGHLWSCANRHLGIRGPGIQQREHENHVHWGLSYRAANDFQESWVSSLGPPPPPPEPEPEELDMAASVVVFPDNDRKAEPHFWFITAAGDVYQRWFALGKTHFEHVAGPGHHDISKRIKCVQHLGLSHIEGATGVKTRLDVFAQGEGRESVQFFRAKDSEPIRASIQRGTP